MVSLKFKLFVLTATAILAASVGAETLSWAPPETRVDGTPLTLEEIAGYRLVCGDVTTEIPVGQTEYDIAKHEALPGYGENSCYMTVLDTDGLESAPSNDVSILYEKSAPEELTIRLL